MFTLPRSAHLWLPGYAKRWWHKVSTRPQVRRVWATIADHYEPLRGDASLQTGLRRVDVWRNLWPAIASRHTDSMGRPPVYTFFYPEEEYHAELIHPLAEMSAEGIADVEVHLHHDGEGEQDFIDRISQFIEVLHGRHGLLRKENGRIRFGFIHGNWALDNSLPDGRGCGLNNELTLLRDLGCYADFTLPSAPSPAQTRILNTIYWAKDDPSRPKSHDTGIPVVAGNQIGDSQACGDLLMIPGPLALNWTERSRGILPRLETGELAAHNPVTAERVRLWLQFAPMVGSDLFLKLFAHGAWEINASQLLNRDLDFAFQELHDQCDALGAELRFVSAFELRQAVHAATNIRAVHENVGAEASLGPSCRRE